MGEDDDNKDGINTEDETAKAATVEDETMKEVLQEPAPRPQKPWEKTGADVAEIPSSGNNSAKAAVNAPKVVGRDFVTDFVATADPKMGDSGLRPMQVQLGIQFLSHPKVCITLPLGE